MLITTLAAKDALSISLPGNSHKKLSKGRIKNIKMLYLTTSKFFPQQTEHIMLKWIFIEEKI